MPSRYIFAADMHLREGDAQRSAVFQDWLARQVNADSALFLLGDVFDAWYALRRDGSLGHANTMQALADCLERGASVSFLTGNRDFLLARTGLLPTGIDVRDEPLTLELDGERVYIAHGDELCAMDWRYQCYKRLVRSMPVYLFFRCLPNGTRMRLAGSMRKGSEAEVARKPKNSMRPTTHTYLQLARSGHSNVVHGHVHEAQTVRVSEQGVSLTVRTLPAWVDDTPRWLEYDANAAAWYWCEGECARRPAD